MFDIAGATRWVDANGLRFPVVDHGSGPPILLLHGFPDSRHLWRYQIPALAAAGFRAIAPDLRGFGEAPLPADVAAYRLGAVAGDVIGLLDALGIGQASLVGHDWGAALGWRCLMTHPARFSRYAALSVGHPASSGFRLLAQRQLSWYMLFFQFEGVAEAHLQHNGWELFRAWTAGARDLDRYLADLARPGALTAGLNWYRANVRPQMPAGRPSYPPIECPVLGVWSDGDAYLVEEGVSHSAHVLAGPFTYRRVEGASHWMMLDQPDAVNQLLIGFFQ